MSILEDLRDRIDHPNKPNLDCNFSLENLGTKREPIWNESNVNNSSCSQEKPTNSALSLGNKPDYIHGRAGYKTLPRQATKTEDFAQLSKELSPKSRSVDKYPFSELSPKNVKKKICSRKSPKITQLDFEYNSDSLKGSDTSQFDFEPIRQTAFENNQNSYNLSYNKEVGVSYSTKSSEGRNSATDTGKGSKCSYSSDNTSYASYNSSVGNSRDEVLLSGGKCITGKTKRRANSSVATFSTGYNFPGYSSNDRKKISAPNTAANSPKSTPEISSNLQNSSINSPNLTTTTEKSTKPFAGGNNIGCPSYNSIQTYNQSDCITTSYGKGATCSYNKPGINNNGCPTNKNKDASCNQAHCSCLHLNVEQQFSKSLQFEDKNYDSKSTSNLDQFHDHNVTSPTKSKSSARAVRRYSLASSSADYLRKLSLSAKTKTSTKMKKISEFIPFRKSATNDEIESASTIMLKSPPISSADRPGTVSVGHTPKIKRKQGAHVSPFLDLSVSLDEKRASQIIPPKPLTRSGREMPKLKRESFKTQLEKTDPLFVDYFREYTSQSDKTFVRKYLELKQNLETKLALLENEYAKLLGLTQNEDLELQLQTLESTQGDDLIFHCVNLFESHENPEKVMALSMHRDYENYIRSLHSCVFENVFKLINIKTLQNSLIGKEKGEKGSGEVFPKVDLKSGNNEEEVKKKQGTRVFESQVFEG